MTVDLRRATAPEATNGRDRTDDHAAAGGADLESFLDPDLDEFLATDDPPYDWVIPDVLERGDRAICTGPEGGGKSVLMRQTSVQCAAGIHPFCHGDMPPIRVALIDCENSVRQVRRHLRPLRELLGDLYEPGMLRINVVGHALELARSNVYEAIALRVTAHQPDLIVIGPLYKMTDGDPTKEEPAKQLADNLDRLRDICGSALLIEAHSPYADTAKTKRPIRPYGASLWSRWPEFGLYLSPDGELEHWRGPRDERAWPTRLERSSPWPWAPSTTIDDTHEPYHGPTHCAERVVEVLARPPRREVSGNQLVELMASEGLSFHKKTVRAAAELAARDGRLQVRDGPNRARLFRFTNQGTINDDHATF